MALTTEAARPNHLTVAMQLHKDNLDIFSTMNDAIQLPNDFTALVRICIAERLVGSIPCVSSRRSSAIPYIGDDSLTPYTNRLLALP